MRKTNLNKLIHRSEVKPGDKIRIVREVVVDSARETNLGRGYADSVVISTKHSISDIAESLALTSKEEVTLLERDERDLVIPEDALFVYWQDDEGDDYYARRDGDKWIEDDGDEHDTDEDLVESIKTYGEVDTFQVLKSKPKLATGGIVQGLPYPGISLGEKSRSMLEQAANAGIRNQIPGYYRGLGRR